MNANELRIGNFVWDDYSGEMIVFGIVDGGINPRLELRKSKTLPAGSYDAEKVQPIPLSEEWLIKFGFEKEFTDSDSYYKSNRHHIVVNETGFYYRVPGVTLKRIDHLHQLQNLYFALTGEELTLTP